MTALLPGEIIVDSFAGGGGASTGILMALGRGPDVAINHNAEAIAMHEANHPETRHFCESVWDVSPKQATGGRKVGLAWFSPDCKHFSKAKGGQPVDSGVRGLAWVVIRWARDVQPRVIFLENVEEWQTWGPLLPDGRPCPASKGMTFRRWMRDLRAAGYQVEHRELRACDYGAPTTRKRLFVIARCDGQPIVWPTPTHGPGRAHPWRTAAKCIDFTLPCPSIFGRARPLAENTMKRIARGLKRYVIDAAEPFIVPLTHHGERRVHPLSEPMPTVTGAHRGELAMVAPTMVQVGYGERQGQAPRCLDIQEPLGTVVAGGGKHALCAAFIAKHFGDNGQAPGSQLSLPLSTVTTVDHNALVASHLVKLRGGLADHHTTAQDLRQPLPTLTAGGTHLGEVRAFLTKYYSADSQDPQLTLPLHTITTRDRFGLVMVHGEPWQIVDIGMRMLSPRELFRAQGFPDTYIIDRGVDGKPLSKTAQVRMAGNSVCPQMGAALVAANLGGAMEVAA